MKYLSLVLLFISCSSASRTDSIVKMAIKKVSPDLQRCVSQNRAAINDDELITNLHFTMGTDGKPKNVLVLDKDNELIQNDELRVCQASVIKRIRYTKGFDQEAYIVQPLRYRLK